MIAELLGVNRTTAILFHNKLRELIVENLTKKAPFLCGGIAVDQGYFGGARKGKRGRGAFGKVLVFGLLKRGGRVHAVMIPDAKSLTLLGIIRERIRPDSIVYTDSLASYNKLDTLESHHETIPRSSSAPETTSTVSKPSGVRPNAISAATTPFQKRTSTTVRPATS